MYTIPKKGYYVAQIEGLSMGNHLKKAISYDISIPEEKSYEYDFSNKSDVVAWLHPASFYGCVS